MPRRRAGWPVSVRRKTVSKINHVSRRRFDAQARMNRQRVRERAAAAADRHDLTQVQERDR